MCADWFKITFEFAYFSINLLVSKTLSKSSSITDTENAKKRPSFCKQAHTATLLSMYNKIDSSVANKL